MLRGTRDPGTSDAAIGIRDPRVSGPPKIKHQVNRALAPSRPRLPIALPRAREHDASNRGWARTRDTEPEVQHFVGRLGLRAIPMLGLLLAGCAVPDTASVEPSADPVSGPTAARVSASLGAGLSKTTVEAALDATVAAGPARFWKTYGLVAEEAGYAQTLSRSDGVIDLSASRSEAITEDFPGQPVASKREVALAGNQMFARPLPGGGAWEKRSGGARSFMGLDVAGDDAISVLKNTLSEATTWTVIATEPGDPPGSIRARSGGDGTADVAVVIDASGRLVSVIRHSIPGSPGGGSHRYEMTFPEFGVPLQVDAPR